MDDSTAGSANLHNSHINGVVVGVNLGTIIYGRPPEEAERKRMVTYLEQVTKSHTIMRVVGDNSAHLTSGINLASVYMMLAVQRRQRVVRPLTLDEFASYQQHVFEIPDELSSESCLPDRAIINVEEDGHSGMISLFRAELATETVLDHQHLVICGAPGSGKSTFANHLVWALAQRGLDQINQQTNLLGWDDQYRLLPVFMPLRRLAGALIGKDLGLKGRPNIGLLLNSVYTYLHDHYGLKESHALFDAGLAGSLKVLLVFDGLDEVPLEANTESIDRSSLLTYVLLFANAYDARILITCRSRAWTEEYRQMTHWPMVELAPLSGGQMTQFISNWFPQLHAKGVIDHSAVERYRHRLVQALHDPKREKLRVMAGNPLLLSMMIFVLAKKGVLPRDRHSLYDDILKQLLGEWDTTSRDGQNLGQAVGDERITGEEVRDQVLDRLCYQAHLKTTSHDGRGRIPSRELKNALMEYFARVNVVDPFRGADRCITYIDQCSGLIQPEDAGNVYVFAHLTLQEHSAGRHLLFYESLDQLLMLRRDDRWREPIFLGVGCLTKVGLGSAKIEQILTALVDSDAYKAGEMHQYDWYRDLILAAELGADCDWGLLRGKQIKVDRIQRRLREGLVMLLEDHVHAQAALVYEKGQAMKPAPLLVRERQKAAELLAALGDPRYPVSITQWRQETCQLSTRFGHEGNHYWRFIPAGRYEVGGWNQSNHQQIIDVKEFWVARFPITVAQYKEFITENGYKNNSWWRGKGNKWQQEFQGIGPHLWDIQIYSQYQNQPVYGVCWYEASAYLEWVMSHIKGMIPEGYHLRLPTETEWEIASRPSIDSFQSWYPWGDLEPTPEHAIYNWSQTSSPASVGITLLGSSGCGALDMMGNLWEWTDTASSPRRMRTCGGSFLSGRKQLIRQVRGANEPHSQVADITFRCVIVPNS